MHSLHYVGGIHQMSMIKAYLHRMNELKNPIQLTLELDDVNYLIKLLTDQAYETKNDELARLSDDIHRQTHL